jgi:hypothetical protein
VKKYQSICRSNGWKERKVNTTPVNKCKNALELLGAKYSSEAKKYNPNLGEVKFELAYFDITN